MATAEGPAVPIGMRRVCRRFERWRSSRTGRDPIPEPLWAAAVDLAREHGVTLTAQALHLDGGRLKRLMQSASLHKAPRVPPSAFVELVAPPTAGASECIVELESSRGKMRIQWKGATAPDPAALSRTLWESA